MHCSRTMNELHKWRCTGKYTMIKATTLNKELNKVGLATMTDSNKETLLANINAIKNVKVVDVARHLQTVIDTYSLADKNINQLVIDTPINIIKTVDVAKVQDSIKAQVPTVKNVKDLAILQAKLEQTKLEMEAIKGELVVAKKELATKKTTKKIVPTVSTVNVKVVLNTANRELTAPIVYYWLCRHEIAIQQQKCKKNLQGLQSVYQLYSKKLDSGDVSYLPLKLDAEKALKAESVKCNEIMSTINTHKKNILDRLPRNLYLGYVDCKTSNKRGEFDKALKSFFTSNGVTTTQSLLDYFVTNIGVVSTSGNALNSSNLLVTTMNENKFVGLFIDLLGNLYLDKKVVDFTTYLDNIQNRILDNTTLAVEGHLVKDIPTPKKEKKSRTKKVVTV